MQIGRQAGRHYDIWGITVVTTPSSSRRSADPLKSQIKDDLYRDPVGWGSSTVPSPPP